MAEKPDFYLGSRINLSLDGSVPKYQVPLWKTVDDIPVTDIYEIRPPSPNKPENQMLNPKLMCLLTKRMRL